MAAIAVVFDFDDTLVPDSTTALLHSRGIDVGEFWSELVPRLVNEGYDTPLAYLRLMLDRIGAGKPLDGSTDAKLGESEEGEIRFVKRCVTFTEKTRYLFEINKGKRTEVSRRQPHAVNNKVAYRRVPFSNMIYVGDGLTDIPCFSPVREGGGRTFGVLAKNKTAKQAFEDLLQERRVDSLHSPDYREDADLGALIRAAVYNLATTIDLGREQA